MLTEKYCKNRKTEIGYFKNLLNCPLKKDFLKSCKNSSFGLFIQKIQNIQKLMKRIEKTLLNFLRKIKEFTNIFKR